MKLRELHINDDSLLDPSQKSRLEGLITKCFQKAQEKAQEIVGEKTKEIL
jgi:DNA-binding protein YbaB